MPWRMIGAYIPNACRHRRATILSFSKTALGQTRIPCILRNPMLFGSLGRPILVCDPIAMWNRSHLWNTNHVHNCPESSYHPPQIFQLTVARLWMAAKGLRARCLWCPTRPHPLPTSHSQVACRVLCRVRGTSLVQTELLARTRRSMALNKQKERYSSVINTGWRRRSVRSYNTGLHSRACPQLHRLPEQVRQVLTSQTLGIPAKHLVNSY